MLIRDLKFLKVIPINGLAKPVVVTETLLVMVNRRICQTNNS